MSGGTSWFPFYVSDYLGDTRRLSTTEHGAYLLLMMEQWQHGDLPDDDHVLAKIAGMRIDHWKRISQRIRSYFGEGAEPGTLRQKRLHAEREKAVGLVAKRTKAANARWTKDATVQDVNNDTSDAAKPLKANVSGDAHADAKSPVCTSQPQPHQEKEGLRPSSPPPADGADLFGKAEGSKPPKPAGAAKPKPIGALRDEGVAKLAALTGRPEKKLFSVVQLWIRQAGGDLAAAEAVHGFISEASDRAMKPCSGWITDQVQRYAARDLAASEPLPEVIRGFRVADVVTHCGDLAHATLEGLWPEFPRIVAEALISGADPERDIYPVARKLAGRIGTVTSAGFFVKAFNPDAERRAAA